jgi:site-specific recombinase XerD
MACEPRLVDQIRGVIRSRHYCIRTERSYIGWIIRFIRFHGIRHPKEIGKPEAEAFLSHLAVDRNVSAATHNQALSAILFLYKDVLRQELPWMDSVVGASRPARLPVVLTKAEVIALITNVSANH